MDSCKLSEPSPQNSTPTEINLTVKRDLTPYLHNRIAHKPVHYFQHSKEIVILELGHVSGKKIGPNFLLNVLHVRALYSVECTCMSETRIHVVAAIKVQILILTLQTLSSPFSSLVLT